MYEDKAVWLMGIFLKDVLCSLHTDFLIFEVLGEFCKYLKEPRSDQIYSEGNWGVRKSSEPWGTKTGRHLMPSLGGSGVAGGAVVPPYCG